MPRPAASSSTEDHPDAKGTRERILDVALDLFADKGYDKTSLREIAEQLGVTKAALYYHFASKDEILLALHLRFHDLARKAFLGIGDTPATPAAWGALLQEMVGEMLANRKLLVLHERNRGALEAITAKHPHMEHHHDADHLDFEAQFRRVLTDERTPLPDRVRVAGALGAIVGGLLAYAQVFSDTPVEEYEKVLQDIVGDVLPPVQTSPTPTQDPTQPTPAPAA